MWCLCSGGVVLESSLCSWNGSRLISRENTAKIVNLHTMSTAITNRFNFHYYIQHLRLQGINVIPSRCMLLLNVYQNVCNGVLEESIKLCVHMK